MGRYKFLTWYRLKSNNEYLFLKISAKGYLDEQPTSVEDAVAFAAETLEATREMHDILAQDNRLLFVKMDLRDFAFEEVNMIPLLKYAPLAASQGMDIATVEITGANPIWNYLATFLPKYTRDRIVLK